MKLISDTADLRLVRVMSLQSFPMTLRIVCVTHLGITANSDNALKRISCWEKWLWWKPKSANGMQQFGIDCKIKRVSWIWKTARLSITVSKPKGSIYDGIGSVLGWLHSLPSFAGVLIACTLLLFTDFCKNADNNCFVIHAKKLPPPRLENFVQAGRAFETGEEIKFLPVWNCQALCFMI